MAVRILLRPIDAYSFSLNDPARIPGCKIFSFPGAARGMAMELFRCNGLPVQSLSGPVAGLGHCRRL